MTDHRALPIGIFDSGMGGLTVLRALLKRLPHENFRFLGDTARLPYGTKGKETIIHYTLNSARKLVETFQVKMLIIACNTATSAALPALQKAFPDIPVEGVVEPGARAAVNASEGGSIAVLATEATIAGGAYERAIHKLKPDAKIIGRPCTLFVALAEEGWTEGDVAEATTRRYIGDLFKGEDAPDTVLLGCTHFPLLKNAVRAVIGQKAKIVDSAQTTAEAVAQILVEKGLDNPSQEPGDVRFLVTDNTKRFARIGGLFLGRRLDDTDVDLVNLS